MSTFDIDEYMWGNISATHADEDRSRRYSEDQPRDDHGRFAGGGSSTMEKVAEPIKAGECTDQSSPNPSREVSHEEFQRLAAEGKAQIDALKAASSAPSGLDQHWGAIKDQAFAAAQQSWGGVTVDAHSGATLALDGQDKYAITVKGAGQQSVSVPENATRAEFNAAMDQARQQFGSQLSMQGGCLGIFHDDGKGTIDIDPTLIVDSQHQVDTVGAYTHAVGGAYHYATGDGYFPPHVAQRFRSRLGMCVKHRWALRDYNPDQPRDDHGRWEGSGSSLDTSHLQPKDASANPSGLDNKDVEARLQGILDRANPADAKWYADQHDLIDSWAAQHNVDTQTLTAMVAATSPQCAWDTSTGRLLNLELAVKAAEYARAYPGQSGQQVMDQIEHPGGLKTSLKNAIDIYNGKQPSDVLRAAKVRSFFNNLAFPNQTRDVTVDTHMARAIAGDHGLKDIGKLIGVDTTKAKDIGRYGWAADRIRAVAAANNMSPAEAQAAIWCQWRREG